jgi:hypothetical protein
MEIENRPSPLDGIYITAFFCRDIMEERDGVVTAIRLCELFQVSIPDGFTPQTTTFPPVEIKAVLTFKSEVPRSFRVSLRGIDPNGTILGMQHWKCQTLGNVHGNMILANIRVASNIAGVFWFDVLVDGELGTRMPLRVAHQLATEVAEPSSVTNCEPGQTESNPQ